MVQSVELLLDAALDAAVRHQWDALAAAGVPSQAHHRGASNRPHVTLAVASSLPAGLERPLANAVAAALPLPLRLGAPVLFGAGERLILVRLVVPTRALLDLHAAIADIVRDCPGRPATAAPDNWTPHVTLARRLARHQLPAAVTVLDAVPVGAGTGVAVRRWDGEERREWPL